MRGKKRRGERNRWESKGVRREGGGRERRGGSIHSRSTTSLKLSNEERTMSVRLENLVNWKFGRKKK